MKNKQKKIFFLNDLDLYNQRYRYGLISKCFNSGLSINSFGIFDGVFSFVYSIFILLIPSQIYKHSVLVSNIKSNLLSMMFFTSKAVVIVNGLGRWRNSKPFRFCFIILMNCNFRKIFAIQNYADYRYLSKFSISKKRLEWIPGSGGTKRSIGDKDGYSVVQRPDKLKLVKSDISKVIDMFNLDMVHIVGCNGSHNESWNGADIIFTGYVDQNSIFQYSNGFIQPGGYGEGLPQTLADAVASNMNIIISKSQYVKYGLGLLGGRLANPDEAWSKLIINPRFQRQLSSKYIVDRYYKLLMHS